RGTAARTKSGPTRSAPGSTARAIQYLAPIRGSEPTVRPESGATHVTIRPSPRQILEGETVIISSSVALSRLRLHRLHGVRVELDGVVDVPRRRLPVNPEDLVLLRVPRLQDLRDEVVLPARLVLR